MPIYCRGNIFARVFFVSSSLNVISLSKLIESMNWIGTSLNDFSRLTKYKVARKIVPNITDRPRTFEICEGFMQISTKNMRIRYVKNMNCCFNLFSFGLFTARHHCFPIALQVIF